MTGKFANLADQMKAAMKLIGDKTKGNMQNPGQQINPTQLTECLPYQQSMKHCISAVDRFERPSAAIEWRFASSPSKFSPSIEIQAVAKLRHVSSSPPVACQVRSSFSGSRMY
jgi:hypothetical protein